MTTPTTYLLQASADDGYSLADDQSYYGSDCVGPALLDGLAQLHRGLITEYDDGFYTWTVTDGQIYARASTGGDGLAHPVDTSGYWSRISGQGVTQVPDSERYHNGYTHYYPGGTYAIDVVSLFDKGVMISVAIHQTTLQYLYQGVAEARDGQTIDQLDAVEGTYIHIPEQGWLLDSPLLTGKVLIHLGREFEPTRVY